MTYTRDEAIVSMRFIDDTQRYSDGVVWQTIPHQAKVLAAMVRDLQEALVKRQRDGETFLRIAREGRGANGKLDDIKYAIEHHMLPEIDATLEATGYGGEG